ncbi:MAG: ATP-binding cassette domain-containing protein [Chitinivibrionales bacterium]|nr:ATP-binding cassette domain-containing protein [Chitinivibrionales bacterium]MBD3358905.1 ATP-binding cassette domain-containing protein [Chitinivibrionales bacterium]
MMIKIAHLSFGYNGIGVLHDISASIGHGERWAIIGRNGAGKSTLVRCIAGLIPVQSGSITLNGKEVGRYGAAERARLITYVPQARGNRLPFEVEEYVLMGRFPYRGLFAVPTRRDRRIAEHAMELTDTAHLAHRSMATLSGGELQRVLLAGAVSQRTSVMLLDEPATFLDPLHQAMLQAALDRIHDQFGTTIVTVTHDVNVAIERYENVLAIVDGKVRFAGPLGASTAGTELLREIYHIGFEVATVGADASRRIVVPRGGAL